MDANECNTIIAAAKGSAGKSVEELLIALERAGDELRAAAKAKFGRAGEH